MGLEIQQVIKSEKQEIYVVARKPLPEEEEPPEEKEFRGIEEDED